MNVQDFDEPVIFSDNANQTELGANDPVLNPDPLADKVLADEALPHEAPIGSYSGSSVNLLFSLIMPIEPN
jgi:hypothetical protein